MQWEMFKNVLLEFGVPSNRLESYYYLFEEYSAKVSSDTVGAVDTVGILKEMRFYVAEVFGQYILVK